ncbi:MAG: glycosyltransferase family 2 protein [Psychroflexus sp.]|nr:glycosyltransferase family 2 protein [Psychroflexus sp.]
MISFLIPTYNYDARPLVDQLKQLAVQAGIDYEILVNDDGSQQKTTENQKINDFEKCFFQKNNKNLGRAGNINRLVQRAKFRYCILLDCDVKPLRNDFLAAYLKLCQPNQICFGGINYDNQKPENGILRWKYGIYQEARNIKERQKRPYRYLLTSNLLFDKYLFKHKLFNDQLKSYGYEDLLLVQYLKQKIIKVNHIDNPVTHINLETSEIYLQKTQTALVNLAQLVKQNKVDVSLTGVSYWGNKLHKLKISKLYKLVFKTFKAILEKNSLGKKPNLILFKMYKLGFYLNQF